MFPEEQKVNNLVEIMMVLIISHILNIIFYEKLITDFNFLEKQLN